MKTIAIVAGARPNSMKIAPIVRALRKEAGDLAFTIIHTGQQGFKKSSPPGVSF